MRVYTYNPRSRTINSHSERSSKGYGVVISESMLNTQTMIMATASTSISKGYSVIVIFIWIIRCVLEVVIYAKIFCDLFLKY